MSSPTRMPRLTSRLGGARQIDIGPDADRQHDEIGGRISGHRRARTALGPLGAGDFLGLAVGEKGDAARSRSRCSNSAGGGIELALHQRRHQVHERNRHAAPLKAPGRFETEQTAADDDGALCFRAPPRSSPRHRQCRGSAHVRAGRGRESAAPAASSRWRAIAVVRRRRAVGEYDRRGGAVDRDGGIAEHQA